MDPRLIERFERYPFSSARRLFVLEQMLLCADDALDDGFGERCRVIIDIDRVMLRRELERRRPPMIDNAAIGRLYSSSTSPHELHRRAHRKFVDLIRFVLTTMSPAQARELLGPAIRQLRRLRQFARRRQHHGNNHAAVCAGL